MKGVILAGGSGATLYPSSKVTNKHLLPVFNKPMIQYPIETLKRSGISDILIITGHEHAGDFMSLLGSGSALNVNLTYRIQDGNEGSAKALLLAQDFIGDETLAVIFADNIFEEDFADTVFYFQRGAQLFLKKSDTPSQYGVVEVREDKSIRSIEEKPNFPKSKLIQTGLFLYDNTVFDRIKKLESNAKGLKNITELNQTYLEDKAIKSTEIKGTWADAGTHEGLLEASILMQEALDPIRKLSRQQKALEVLPQKQSPKVTIGLTTYNSEAYILPCLESLLAQDYKNYEIVIWDNGSSDGSVTLIKESFPQIKVYTSSENKGFSRAHNAIIRETENDFYACFNIDMIFEVSFLSELVQTIQENPSYGSAGGKLKRWDFKNHRNGDSNGKTNLIDSVGIRMLKSHRFEDIGQGKVDFGQFDQPRDVFGISGAAVLYRREALEDTAFLNTETDKKEYFDESMFIYKEDVDLAYRLQWAGWHARYTPLAVAYHDRTTASIGQRAVNLISNRGKKDKNINRVSYLNHQILLEKNFADNFSASVKGATFWWNLKVFVYLLLFETETLGQWWKYLKVRKKIRAQRHTMPRRVARAEIEKFMEV